MTHVNYLQFLLEVFDVRKVYLCFLGSFSGQFEAADVSIDHRPLFPCRALANYTIVTEASDEGPCDIGVFVHDGVSQAVRNLSLVQVSLGKEIFRSVLESSPHRRL